MTFFNSSSKVGVTGLTDMHNHILYGVDDGADDLETSIKMLKMAYDDGIRNMVLTPHHHPRRGMAHYSEIVKNFNTLFDVAQQMLPDMNLYLGREIYFASDITQDREKFYQKTMNGSNTALIEFSSNVSRDKIRSGALEVIMSGFHPVIAHIERYGCTIEDYEYVYELKDMGVDIQINADSLLGENGSAVKRCVKKLMEDELVDYIASDAHDIKYRAPLLSKCYALVSKKYGSDYADKLMRFNPEEVFSRED